MGVFLYYGGYCSFQIESEHIRYKRELILIEFQNICLVKRRLYKFLCVPVLTDIYIEYFKA